MAAKIQVLLNEYERDLFRQQAKADGMSLSSWLKQAGHERLSATQARCGFKSVGELDVFFRRCDESERGREPDWEQHLQVINQSKDSGLPDT